jgi:hypothetical protein
MAYEDFTTFTEEEPDNRIDVQSSTHVVFTSYRNEDAWCVKDYTADYFGDFTHDIDIKCIEIGGSNDMAVVYLLANAVEEWKYLRDNSYKTLGVDFFNNGGSKRLRLHYFNGSSLIKDYMTGVSEGDWYYLRITRSGTSLVCDIYETAEDRTNEEYALDQLSVTCDSTSYRYLYVATTYNSGTGYLAVAHIDNLDLGGLGVTTDAYSNLADTTVTLNGSYDVAVTKRGFDWGTTEGGPYPNEWYEEGSFEAGSFSHGLTSLTSGQRYYYKAKADAGDGWVYGNEKSFVTFAPFLGTWRWRIRLDIDADLVSEDLTNFPILLYLGSSSGISGDDITTIFDRIGSEKLKIAVTTDDGVTQCYVEVERWDDGNEDAWLWVKVPSIDATYDEVLYIYYDPLLDDNTDYVNETGVGNSVNVWDSNFKAVYHMQDATSSTIKDSTTNGNDGDKVGADQPTELAGKIDKAQDFDGDEYIDCGDDASLKFTAEVTIELYFYWNALPVDIRRPLGRWDTGSQRSYGMYVTGATNDKMRFVVSRDGEWTTPRLEIIEDANMPNQTWLYYAGTYKPNDASKKKLYRNGVDVTNILSDMNNTIHAGTSNLMLGCHEMGAAKIGHVNAREDEVRISSVARSAGWIASTHQTLLDTFHEWGSEEVGLKPPILTTDAVTNRSTSTITLNGNITNIGVDSPDERGFEWGTETGVYPNEWTEEGTFGTGTYSRGLTGLTHGETYYMRAKAHNTDGWGYGSEVSFTMKVVLAVNSTPISGIDFDDDASSETTPYTTEVDVNTDHVITMPYEQTIATVKWRFLKWEDESTNRIRTVSVTTSDVTVTATYNERYTLNINSLPTGIVFTLEKI